MTEQELEEHQGWSLSQKIDHSLEVIEIFTKRLNGKVYVSFSGGKDSTVMLDLCRIIDPNMKAVFCNTGNEYPDIYRFVRHLRDDKGYNIEIIKPKLTPQAVLTKYGFPLVSKEQSTYIERVQLNPNSKVARRAMGLDETSQFIISKKWRFLTNKPYKISPDCCQKLKKDPFHAFEKRTGLHPILGMMASESIMRKNSYLRQGNCNSFGDNSYTKRIRSLPLSIWLEKDIWDYIKTNHLEISNIYNKGAQRTGCMFCGYGCQFADDNRLELCYKLYPKMYEHFMNYDNNGITYREALRDVLSVNGLYLPDENPQTQLNL